MRQKNLLLNRFVLTSFIFFYLGLFSFQGISYRHVTTPDPLSIHILEVDPSYYTIIPVHAHDCALGRETVQRLAKQHQAFAAVNGGFFKGDKWEGLPAGVLKINQEWLSLPYQPRGAIGWTFNGQQVLIDRLLISIVVNVQGRSFLLNGLNRPLKANEMVLFSPQFNTTTLTNSNSFEFVILDNQIKAIYQTGNHLIPDKGWVLSIAPEQDLSFWKQLKEGTPIHIEFKFRPKSNATQATNWAHLPHIVGGTPVLISKGKLIKDFSPEKTKMTFLHLTHARTAIGILPNGHWLFVVIDGNQPLLSQGMTIPQLAQYMYQLGCREAINLDGGGSSTMVIQDQVINHPYGDEDEDQGVKKVRKVSDAILILEKHE